jgi:UDP-glucose 4-epimerase
MPAPDGSVAVTGAGGYLGGRVASALGERARAIVRTPVAWLPARTQVACDLLGPADDLTRALDGVDTVVHLAGHNEVVSGRDPDTAIRETVQMAENVLRAAAANGVRRIVYVSTVHVYGERLVPGAVVDESIEPAPTSAYARARWECEQVLAGAPVVDAVRLRLTNAVGAPADPSVDRWTLVASDLCLQGVLDRRLVLHSAGLQWRDFIALEDACRLAVGSLDEAVAPGTYNLAAGRSLTIRALAELVQDRIERTCGWRPDIAAPPATGEAPAAYTVDPGKLAAAGLGATTSLPDAVEEIVEHCTKHEATLRRGRPER